MPAAPNVVDYILVLVPLALCGYLGVRGRWVPTAAAVAAASFAAATRPLGLAAPLFEAPHARFHRLYSALYTEFGGRRPYTLAIDAGTTLVCAVATGALSNLGKNSHCRAAAIIQFVTISLYFFAIAWLRAHRSTANMYAALLIGVIHGLAALVVAVLRVSVTDKRDKPNENAVAAVGVLLTASCWLTLCRGILGVMRVASQSAWFARFALEGVVTAPDANEGADRATKNSAQQGPGPDDDGDAADAPLLVPESVSLRRGATVHGHAKGMLPPPPLGANGESHAHATEEDESPQKRNRKMLSRAARAAGERQKQLRTAAANVASWSEELGVLDAPQQGAASGEAAPTPQYRETAELLRHLSKVLAANAAQEEREERRRAGATAEAPASDRHAGTEPGAAASAGAAAPAAKTARGKKARAPRRSLTVDGDEELLHLEAPNPALDDVSRFASLPDRVKCLDRRRQ